MDNNCIIESGMFDGFSFWCNIISNKHIILITLYIIYMYIEVSTTIMSFNYNVEIQ